MMSTIGPSSTGFDAAMRRHIEALAWFDHWLKGRDTGILEGPPIRYRLAGTDGWQATDQWPPPGSRITGLPRRLTQNSVRPADAVDTRAARRARSRAPTPSGTPIRAAPARPTDLGVDRAAGAGRELAVGAIDVVLDAATTALDTAWMFTLQDVASDDTVTSVTPGGYAAVP